MHHLPRVLVIEDDPQQARIIELRLTKHNQPFEVELANNTTVALEKLAEQHFDIVTLDYHLPSMSGLQMLEKIKKQFSYLPVIMLTGQGDEEIAVKAMRNGAHDYLTKGPEHFELLPRVLHRAIRENHLSQQLEQSRKRYFDLFHNANLAIFVVDAETFQILQLNHRAQSMLHLSPEVWRQKAFFNLVAPHQQAVIENLFSNIKKSGRAAAENVFLKAQNKRSVPTEINGSLVKSGEQHFIELFVNDISEKLKMHRQLLLSQQRLLSLFNGITDLICVINSDYDLLMGNKRYLEFTGNSSKSLSQKKCYTALFNRTSPCETCPALDTYHTGESNYVEMFHEERIYQIWTFPMRNLEGRPDYIVEYTKDVTEQKELERQLIKAEKLASIGLLSSGIAHELRNPLNIIEAARYTIESHLNSVTPEIDKNLKKIRTSVQRASSIIENLLKFSRHSEFLKEKVDVGALLKSTIALLYKEMTGQNIRPLLSLAPIPRVFCNIDSLKQVFLNIILNAVQAMPDGGELRVRSKLSADQQWVEIEFNDTGVGISDENMAHLFTPFFTTKGPSGGTGLGLYLSYTLLNREGGDIVAKGNEGRGTTFVVKLPVAQEQDATH